MYRFFMSLLFLAFVSTAHAAITELPQYNLDPGHTRVIYRISHLGFSQFPGVIPGVTGTILFDPEKVEQSKLDVTIDAKTVTMNHEVLDKKLQGKEFFNTEKYPTITFKSTTIERSGPQRGKVTGDLTFLGVTKPVTLNVKFNKKAWNSYMKTEMVGFNAWGKIRRSDFGMKAYLPDVGDEITLSISAEASQPVKGDTAAETKKN